MKRTLQITQIALFAALTAVFSQISFPVPMTPIVFTMGVMAVYLTAALLPKWQAFLALIVYLLLGAIGLPGDASPASRYVKAAFHKLNAPERETEDEQVSQFFHLLDSVAMVRGSVVTEEGRFDITTYSCCVSAGKGIYYYKTSDNSRIRAVRLFGENLNAEELLLFPLCEKQDIRFLN